MTVFSSTNGVVAVVDERVEAPMVDAERSGWISPKLCKAEKEGRVGASTSKRLRAAAEERRLTAMPEAICSKVGEGSRGR